MEKYVSAETAQRLKALGFKERVLTYYENGVPKLHNDITGWDFNTSFMTCVSRPTFSQAFLFIMQFPQIKRYKYNIALYSDGIYSIKEGKDSIHEYLSAEDCLDKLLEIVEKSC